MRPYVAILQTNPPGYSRLLVTHKLCLLGAAGEMRCVTKACEDKTEPRE